MNAQQTDLVAVRTLKAVDVFAPGGVERIVAEVETLVRSTKIDAATDEGRAEAKSLAYKVARTKTGLDELGKDFVAEIKLKAAGIDADRRLIRERLDALRDEVRKPVDDWEAAEEKRQAAHVANLETLTSLETWGADQQTVAEIERRIVTLDGLCGLDWQEFSERAQDLVGRIGPALATLHAAAKKRDEERAELERLRTAEAERQAAAEAERIAREQRERDERIAAESAARARQAAEVAAAAEQRRVEQEKADAITRAERAEADAKAAAARAEEEKRLAKERAEIARQQAIEDERRRVPTAEQAAADEKKRREQDRDLRARVNNAAVGDLILQAALTEEQAKAVVVAIATGKIACVSINY